MIKRCGWLLLLSACATAPRPPAESSGPEQVKMEPILVRAAPDPLTGLDGYDAEALLEVGNEQFRQEAYDRAIKVFEKLLEQFPDSATVPKARYNIGLSYEQLAEPEKAHDQFRKVIELYPGTDAFKDAHFRDCLSLAKLGRWKEVADTFWAARQLQGLTVMDELEARVGQGVAMFMQEDYATAEREFMSAIRFFEAHEKNEYLPAEYFVGQARFYLGEIYAREFERYTLKAPEVGHEQWVEMMGKELEEKCQLLLRAQNNLIRAIRVGHAGWATASGFRIGSLYERLYDDLIQVPVPPGVDDEAKAYYQTQLREKVSVLVVKAIKIYEQSLQMAQRVGEKNEWVERTSVSLERMKSLYLSQKEG